MWDDGIMEDGYINIYMNIRDREVTLSDEFPSTSEVRNGKSYSTHVKVKSNSRMHINFDASPMTLDPSMFATPKKSIIYIKSPELIRRSPRLIAKSIVASSGFRGSVSSKKLFVNVDDDDEAHKHYEISFESRQAELEYVNIQLDNDAEDICHPTDDCRSPMNNIEEMGIQVYMNFCNTYFGGENNFDFLHPQKYKKVAAERTTIDSDVVVEDDPKGNSVVPFDEQLDDDSYHSKVDVQLQEELDLFPDENNDLEEFVDIYTMFMRMEFKDMAEFKKRLRGYAIKKGFQYKLNPIDKERIRVNCKYDKKQSCEFFIHASITKDKPTFTVRKFNLKHTYLTDHLSRNRAANAEFVAAFLYDKLKNGDPMPLPYSLRDQFHTTHNTSVPYHVAWRARTMVIEKLNGSYDESVTNYTYGRHMLKNFKTLFKGSKLSDFVCNAAKCYKERHWKAHMDNLLRLSPVATNYMMNELPRQWSRVIYDHSSCCEHTNRNFSEYFNIMISQMRDKPICPLGMMYVQLVMGILYWIKTLFANWVNGTLVPTAEDFIKKMQMCCGGFRVNGAVYARLYELLQ